MNFSVVTNVFFCIQLMHAPLHSILLIATTPSYREPFLRWLRRSAPCVFCRILAITSRYPFLFLVGLHFSLRWVQRTCRGQLQAPFDLLIHWYVIYFIRQSCCGEENLRNVLFFRMPNVVCNCFGAILLHSRRKSETVDNTRFIHEKHCVLIEIHIRSGFLAWSDGIVGWVRDIGPAPTFRFREIDRSR